MYSIITQVIGIVAAVIAGLSYQAKTPKGIAMVQCVSGTLFAANFFMLGAFTGAAMNVIGLGRNLFYCFGKKEVVAKTATPIIVSSVFVIAGALSWNGWFSILPIIGMVVSSFTYWLENARVARLMCLITSIAWIIYNIKSFSIGGIATEVFALFSIFTAIIRYDVITKGVEK